MPPPPPSMGMPKYLRDRKPDKARPTRKIGRHGTLSSELAKKDIPFSRKMFVVHGLLLFLLDHEPGRDSDPTAAGHRHPAACSHPPENRPRQHSIGTSAPPWQYLCSTSARTCDMSRQFVLPAPDDCSRICEQMIKGVGALARLCRCT